VGIKERGKKEIRKKKKNKQNKETKRKMDFFYTSLREEL
jgi:hypothetical protein